MKKNQKAPRRRVSRKRGAFVRSVLAILDPYCGYNFHKDTSHLLLLGLSQRGHTIFYSDPSSLFFKTRPLVLAKRVSILENEPYFLFHEEEKLPLEDFSLILIRKDPPVDDAYLHTTYLLSLVANRVLVVNHPTALRDLNEKIIILNFPKWIPNTLVTTRKREIDRFVESEGGVALAKDLNSFGGKGICQLSRKDPQYLPLIDKLTALGTRSIMVQSFLPQVAQGEKRVFVIDGKPWGTLLKIPPENGYQTNPDLGGSLQATDLTRREEALLSEIGPFLKKTGVFFAGVDLIDERLTEINITSPGLVWEWNEIDHQRYDKKMVDLLERKITRLR